MDSSRDISVDATVDTTAQGAVAPDVTLSCVPPSSQGVNLRATPRRWMAGYAIYAMLTNTRLDQAVWVLYLAGHGFSPFAIGLFETLFHVAKFVVEVPTGIFADLVGRRASLIASCVVGAIGELCLLHPTTLFLALSFACGGVGYAFRGGAESAFVWWLAERADAGEHSARYSRLFSRMLVFALIASTLGLASGGFLARVSILLPFICNGAALATAIVPLLFLPEQRPDHAATHTSARRTLLAPVAHLLAGLAAVRRNPPLLGLLLVSALEASVFTTVSYYTQLTFAGLGVGLATIGLIYSAGSIVDFVATACAPRLLAAVPRRRLLISLVGCLALGIAAMSLRSPLLVFLSFLLGFHLPDATFVPVLSTWLNERAPEEQRATVLSLDTGLFSGAMMVLFPLFGLALTHVSVAVVYPALDTAFVVCLLLTWLLVRVKRPSNG